MSTSERTRASPSASDSQAGAAALESLARAARQVALYGPEHPMGVQGLEQACAALAREAAGKTLEVRAQEKGLVWNGEALPLREGNVARLHTAMREKLLEAIEIDASVGPGELARLVALLEADASDPLARASALLEFRAGGESSIRVREVDFAGEVLASAAAWQQLSRAAETEETGALGRVVAVCLQRLRLLGGEGALARVRVLLPRLGAGASGDGSAEEMLAAVVARIVQEAGEVVFGLGEAQWEAWREEMAREVGALSPRYRSQIFRSPSAASPGCPDMLALIAQGMRVEERVSLVLDHPDSIRAERSERLRLALGRVMSDPAHREEVAELLRREALARGVSETVYENVVGVLTDELGGHVGGKLAHGAGAIEEEDREGAGLGDLLGTTTEESLRRSRAAMLTDCLGAELSMTQFSAVLGLLGEACAESAARGDGESLLEILWAMKEATEGGVGRDGARQTMAAGALARSVGGEAVSCLIQGFADVGGDRRSRIVSLLGAAGERGTAALHSIVQDGDEKDVEAALRAMIAAGREGAAELVRIAAQGGQKAARRVLGMLLESGDRGAPGQLARMVHQLDAADKLEVARLIREGGLRRHWEALAAMLSDASAGVREAAAQSAGELRAREAVPALCELVAREGHFGEGARVREAAVRALGEIRDPSCVPALSQVLLGGGMLGMFGGSQARVSAAEMLATIGGTEAREALTQGSRSLHPGVAGACRAALTRLRVSRPRLRREGKDVR